MKFVIYLSCGNSYSFLKSALYRSQLTPIDWGVEIGFNEYVTLDDECATYCWSDLLGVPRGAFSLSEVISGLSAAYDATSTPR